MTWFFVTEAAAQVARDRIIASTDCGRWPILVVPEGFDSEAIYGYVQEEPKLSWRDEIKQYTELDLVLEEEPSPLIVD